MFSPQITELAAGVRISLASLPRHSREALKWDTLTGLLAGVYIGCIWTFVPRIARADMHASAAQMGWISAAPALGFVFATVWARQMEGRAKLPFVYWTWLAARSLFLLAPFAATQGRYVLMVCMSPIIFSVSTPAYTSIMKDIYPDALRGRLMSVVRIVLSVSTLVTALAAGRVLDSGVDWRVVFVIGGLFGGLTAYTFSRIQVPHSDESPDSTMTTFAFLRDTYAILVRNPGYRWFSASVFVYGFGNIMAFTLYPIYQVDRMHVTNTDVAYLQNIASVLQIGGFFFWGAFMDRKGPLASVLAAIAVICIMPVCYALAPDMRLLYLAAAAGGLALSGVDLGYLNTILLFSEPGQAARYQALHSSLYGIRGVIAPPCAIPLMHWLGPRNAFWACLAVMMAGVLCQLVSMRDYRAAAQLARRSCAVDIAG